MPLALLATLTLGNRYAEDIYDLCIVKDRVDHSDESNMTSFEISG